MEQLKTSYATLVFMTTCLRCCKPTIIHSIIMKSPVVKGLFWVVKKKPFDLPCICLKLLSLLSINFVELLCLCVWWWWLVTTQIIGSVCCHVFLPNKYTQILVHSSSQVLVSFDRGFIWSDFNIRSYLKSNSKPTPLTARYLWPMIKTCSGIKERRESLDLSLKMEIEMWVSAQMSV